MRLFAAGNTTYYEEFCVKYKLPKLYSFLHEQNIIAKWRGDIPLIVDSGAHSWNKNTMVHVGMKASNRLPKLEIYVQQYYEFLRNTKIKATFVEFDAYEVISYKKITELNQGLDIMRVYHPTLDNGSCEVLKQWIAEGHTYIGIGNDSAHIINKIFNITRDKIKLHGFAMMGKKYVENYPFYSADSTSVISTVVYGHAYIKGNKKLDKKKMYATRSPTVFHNNYDRLKAAVIETKKYEKYLTDLWRKRGITWD